MMAENTTSNQQAAATVKYNKEIRAWGRMVASEIPRMAYALGIKDWSFETKEDNYKSIYQGAVSSFKKDSTGEIFSIGIGVPYQAFLSSVLGVGRKYPYTGGLAAVKSLVTGATGRKVNDPVSPVLEQNLESLADIVGEGKADINVALLSDRMGPRIENFGQK